MKKCVICLRPAPADAVGLCKLCVKGFHDTDGLDMWGVVEWVANRARYFERRRK